MTVIVLCDRGLASPKLWQPDHGSGLAPLQLAPYMRYPKKHHLLRRWTVRRLPAQRLRPPSGYRVDRQRHRLRRPQPPNAVAPCWWSGTSSRTNHGSSSPTFRRKQSGSQLVRAPLLDRIGLQGPQEPGPSRAWAGNGTRPAGPTRRVSPATGWCCRWPRCWPWLAHGTRVEDAHDAGFPQATCGRRPGRWHPNTATPGISRTAPSV